MNTPTAMILAAGRGQRLRPLTDHTPKPLIDVGGKALIVHHLEKLQKAGFHRVVINTAHLGAQIKAALGDGQQWGIKITYTNEGTCAEQALETAGGVRNALDHLSDPFVLINGDVFTDLDYQDLLSALPEHCAFKLWLADNPKHHPSGDFVLTDEGLLKPTGEKRLTYSGIGIFRKQLFTPLPIAPAPLGPLLHQAIAGGQGCGAHHTGLWLDVGSPERLAQARQLAE